MTERAGVSRFARSIAGLMGVVLTAGLLVASPLTAPPAEAAEARAFDPGYIVSDENFYDGFAMDAPSVQNFILSRNSRCAAGATCLSNYRQNTPSMAGTRYCRPMTGVGSESAASIIARVGNACGISQKTMLVLLQKEQSLVTSTAPTQNAFNKATGFGCPDTAPCDPAFGGFFYQIYYAANQFQVYRANPNSFNYKARAVNNIRFNPNAACGSSPIYIANDATASLYIYTPYQPNAAAMANLYGTGDACSAYGNRNFWRLWSDWFGSPTGQPITLGRVSGSSATYLLGIGQRFRFPSTELIGQYSGFGAVRELSQSDIDRYVDAGPVQRAVRSTDGSVFLIEPYGRYKFSSCAQVNDFGMSCDALPTIATTQVNALTDLGYLNSLVVLPDRSQWLMQGGQRRETPDPTVLTPYGYSPNASRVSNSAIGGNQIGAPAVGAGVFTNRLGNFRTISGGGVFDLPAGIVGTGLASRSWGLHPFSYERLPASSRTLPTRIFSDNRALILTDGGWLDVDVVQYGGPSRFTAMPARAWNGIPGVRTQRAPHFIREKSNAQLFLVSGPYLQPITPGQQDQIARTYGVENRVWIAADGGLSGIDRLFAQPNDLVRLAGTESTFLVSGAQRHPITSPELLALYAPLGAVRDVTQAQLDAYTDSVPVQRALRGSDGSTYLVDSGKRYRFASCGQAADYGYNCETLPLIDVSQLSSLPVAGALQSLVKLPDASVWFMQSGQRRETPEPRVLARYGVPSTTVSLSNAALAATPVGPPVLTIGVVTDGQGNYIAVGGSGNYGLLTAAVAGGLATQAKSLQPASMSQLPVRSVLPLRANVDGRFLIATDGGWLEVAGTTYGVGQFTSTPSASSTGVPLLRTQLSPHFIRERSSQQVYLISGGTLTAVANTSAQNFIAARYGVENRVWIAADAALRGIPVAP